LDIDGCDYSAYVCNNDEVARRLIIKLKKLGLKVPKDVSVVGFDNHNTEEQITSMEIDIKKMCQSAADILSKKINNDSYSIGRFLVECKLIYKQSVAPPKNR